MSARRKYILIIIPCLVALAVLIFFEPSYGWRLRAWLSPKNIISVSIGDNSSLLAQNEDLQAQLAALQNIAAQLPKNATTGIPALIYSQYPFGFKNELLVNAGADENIATGKAVTFQGIFIGTVQQVFPDYSIVQTVFDPAFKLPVRIGMTGIDALLVGGSYPKITSIAKNATLAGNNIIYTASQGVPYGLPIGIIEATTTSPDNLFQEASVNFAYDIGGIEAVMIEN